MLDGMYNLIHMLLFTIRDLIERSMMVQTRTAHMQRAVQVVFGNMVDMGDRMNSHPGMNSARISCPDSAILPLEASHRLKGIYCCKG